MESLKMIGLALLSGLGGCIGGIPLGIFLVENPAENRHDPSTDHRTFEGGPRSNGT